MKQPDFAKWYFYQLLKDYEGEQLGKVRTSP